MTRLHQTVWMATVLVLGVVNSFAAERADSPVADAARDADWASVQTSLDGGVDVTVSQGDGSTALHWVAHWDELDMAIRLIAAGADVNVVTDLGVTPLWSAAENRSPTMVRRLLAAGADPNAALLSGETVLMTAARSGDAGVVRYLLEAGAGTEVTAARGQTSLMWAVAQRHSDVVEVLLEHGAHVDTRTVMWTEVVKTSPDPWSPEYVTEQQQGGYTPLLFAARVGDLASARLLVEAGANVNDVAPVGTSAVVVAAHSGHGEVASYLVEQGADPDASGAGYTALHAAILHKDNDLVRTLLAHGADPNLTVDRATPVRRDAVDFYLHPSYVGATPFWLAARFGAPDIMYQLAELGADPHAVHYPSYWPGSLGVTEDRRMIEEGPTTALMAAVGLGGRAPLIAVDRLGRIAESAPVRSTRRDPDWEKVEATTLAAVTLAVELGVDLNAADADGNTALHAAARRGYDAVVEYLAAHGADVAATNEGGLTPFDLARQGFGRGANAGPHESTMELLRRLATDQ